MSGNLSGTNGSVGEIRVLSEKGATLSFCLPVDWPMVEVTCDGGALLPKQTSAALRRYEVPTRAGQLCVLTSTTKERALARVKTDDTAAALPRLLLALYTAVSVRALPLPPSPPLSFQMRNSSATYTKHVKPAELAILVIDPWAYHWCKTTTARGEALMPRINAGLQAGRKAGVGAVIFAPTSAVVNYLGWEQRERAVAVHRHTPTFSHAATRPPGTSPRVNKLLCFATQLRAIR